VIPRIDDKYFNILKEELNTNSSWTGELWSEGKNKKAELMSVKMALFEGDENFIVMLCTSITERANLERELRQSEERYRNIVTNTREYICTFDLEGNINYVNPFFAEEFGYSEEEMLSRNIKELINPDHAEENTISNDLIFTQDTTTFETVLIKKNKELVYTIANSNLISDLGGRPSYYNIVFTDISSQKEVEKDLLMIRSMFEASQDGITVQVDRNYVLVNESFTEIFGYDNVDEIVGKDVLDFVAEEDLTKVANYVTAFERGEETPKLYDFKALKKDSSVFNVEKSDSSYETEEGIIVVSTFRDITEVKGARDKLEISEARYRNISRNIDDCMWSAERKDGSFRNIFYSEAIKKITG
ncbi:MAG: PAS domain S-box protein, partial [Candidatus Heimdallarchaeota archaeon]|nr:PAS domain S-box protein [Candidatus Heimdallarchaeota archaeon]